MATTDLSIEGSGRSGVTLVVSKGTTVIRHTLTIDEMYTISSMLLGRMYAYAIRK